MSVTSSGRSSISSTIRVISGWLVVIELAIDLQEHRLAGAGRSDDQAALSLADRARCRSSTREDMFVGDVSSFRSAPAGYSGVRLSKKIFSRATSGCSKLTASTLIRAK